MPWSRMVIAGYIQGSGQTKFKKKAQGKVYELKT